MASKPTKATLNGIADRWGGGDAIKESIQKDGFLGVPSVFLSGLGAIGEYGLSPAETLLVLQLMSHKWDARAPFPSYKRLAYRMGVSEPYARKLARSLEEKGLLKRIERVGSTNRFSLEPLFAILEEKAQASNEARLLKDEPNF
jgi:hypothetical protein